MNVIEKLNSIQNKEMTAKENVENFIKVIDEKNEELIFIWINYFINNTSYIIFTKFCCT